MSLSRRVINRPMTILIVFIVASIVGGVLVKRLAIDLFPDTEMPALAVVTVYPMADPSDVEDSVTRVLEEKLINTSGLEKLTSYSYSGYSLVIMMLEYGTEMSDVKADVRDKVSRIESSMPNGCERPQLMMLDLNDEPVIKLALTGEQGLKSLLKLAEEELKPEFEKLSGVAEASLAGGLSEIVQVSFYRERLDALGLTVGQISSALSMQNTALSAGRLTEADRNYLIQTVGEINSLEELENTIVAVKPAGGRSLYEVLLRDVADVSLGARARDSIVFINGQEGIQLSIKKTDDANMVDVVGRVKLAADRMNDRLPPGSSIAVLSDNSVEVKLILKQVMSSAVLGIVFAVLVLLVFLRRIKTTLTVAISIPVSLLITIGCMSLAGKSFNLITLTGLILALGMIVDGSIVVIENIFRYRQKGALHQPSAELGTQEVIGAITGSILTSVCVFLPSSSSRRTWASSAFSLRTWRLRLSWLS